MFSQWTRNFKKSKSNKLVKMDFKRSISPTFFFQKNGRKKIPWNWFQILSEFFGLDFFIYIFWPAVNILKYCNNIHLSHVNQLLHILVDMQNSWNHKYNVSSERFFITKIFTTKLASINSFSNIVILFLQRNFEVKNCFFLFPNWL